MSKLCGFVYLVLLSIIAVAAWCWLSDRWDTTAYYKYLNTPFPLVDVDETTGTDRLHTDGYLPGQKLTYKVERTSLVTATARTTRRIVKKFQYGEGVAREMVYSYSPQLGVRIDAGSIVSFASIELPSADKLPRGEYLLETSVEFPVRGDLKTFVAESRSFVVK